MNSVPYCKNIQKILHRMGYRQFQKGYVKPVAFACFVFLFRENENKYFLEYWFVGAHKEPLLWKSTEVSDLDSMQVLDFQGLEASTGRDMDVFGYGGSLVQQFVPPLTVAEELVL